jgi:DNA repair protein RadC
LEKSDKKPFVRKKLSRFKKPVTYLNEANPVQNNGEKIGMAEIPGFLRIRQWPEDERPRERLLKKGSEFLTDAQLLAILLRTGKAKASALTVAVELLKRAGGLKALGQLSAQELQTVQGVGPAKAAQIKAALEVGKRIAAKPFATRLKVLSSRDVYVHYHSTLRELKKEVFMAVLLDGKNRVIREVLVSQGSLTVNIVHPREVFNPAIRDSAAAIVVVHNHPSGDPSPSPEDIELTKRLVATGEILGIKVLDHIVVGDGSYFSFSDRQQL